MQNKKDVKKVLHFIPGYSFGGIEERFKDWLVELDRSKATFDLITYIEPSDKRFDELKELGCNIYYLPSIKEVGLFQHIRIAKGFFKEHKDYSALHCHSVDNGYFLLKYAKKNNIQKRIIHARTTSYGNLSFQRIRDFLKSKSIKLATDYFGCSIEALEWLKNGKLDNRCVVINNGIKLNNFRYSDEDRKKLRRHLGIENELVIGHVGRFSYAKNHAFLLKVFSEVIKRIPNSKLLLLGDGELKEEIEQTIYSLNLEHNVIILGYKDNVNEYLNVMDIFVFPSHYEGFGTVLVEAQASGLYCIVSDTVPRATNVTGNIDYLSLESTAIEWAEIIIGKYSISIKSLELRSEYASRLLDTDFDFRQVVRNLEEIYIN